MSVVLDVQPDANYEPSEAEIIEYGKWLGMEFPQDEPFLWIAREGLKAPLPENWKACKSEKGELYYFNFKTGQSIWDHPSDEYYRELFKNEQANPTAPSISRGAKRAGEKPTTSPAKTSKKKQAKSDDVERRETKVAKEKIKPTKVNEVRELKPIQQKKELPASLKISSLAADGGKNGITEAPRVVSPEFHSTTSPSDSSISSNSGNDLKVEEPSSIPLPTKLAAGGGVNGLKALSKLSSPTAEKTQAAESKGEKEKVEKRLADELEAFRREKQGALLKRKGEIEAEVAAELKQYEEGMEIERKKLRLAKEKQIEDALEAERSQLEKDLDTALTSLRQEYEKKRAVDTERLKERYKAQLDHDKRKIEAEVTEVLESFTREKRQESEIKKEAQSQALQEAGKSIIDVKQCSALFLRQYDEALTAFTKAIDNSQSAFDRAGAQKQKELQQELEEKITKLRQEHDKNVRDEKDRADTETRTLIEEHARAIAQLRDSQQQELRRMQDEFNQKQNATQKEQLSKEHERFMETLSSIKEAQETELNALKQQLREKAQEELKEVVQEFAKDAHSRRNSKSRTQGPDLFEDNDTGEQSHASCSLDAASSNKKGKISPPRLDGKLLQSGATEEACTGLTQQTDIKSLITEALREMFAGSPFILPSPALSVQCNTSPGTPSASATPSGALLHGIPDLRSAGDVQNNFPAPVISRPDNAFTFPLSFQEQRSLVDSERKRLQEGRRFVELQQQNLEERKQQLKRTRHQWKQDVLCAKRDGVRSSSKRGQVLNKVRLTLEEQAMGLEHDTAILRDSQIWLISKEQRLMELERHIEEQERLRSRGGDGSAMNNCSVDTAALMTGFFKPQRLSGSSSMSPRRGSWSRGSLVSGQLLPDSTATSPVLSKALSRIEKRLDEVTSIIHQQQQHNNFLGMSIPSYATNSQHRHSSRSPTKRQAMNHHRSSASMTKPELVRRDSHLDPWQGPST